MTDYESSSLEGGKTDEQILIEVFALLSDRRRWCQEAHALTVEGLPVKATDPRAAAWSVQGALQLCSNDLGIAPPHLLKYLDSLVLEHIGHLGPPSIWSEYDIGWFNDYFTYYQVIKLLQRGLRCLQRKQ